MKFYFWKFCFWIFLLFRNEIQNETFFLEYKAFLKISRFKDKFFFWRGWNWKTWIFWLEVKLNELEMQYIINHFKNFKAIKFFHAFVFSFLKFWVDSWGMIKNVLFGENSLNFKNVFYHVKNSKFFKGGFEGKKLTVFDL